MLERLILVVDGDPALRGLVVEVLEEAGYAVAEAEHGQEALELSLQRRPTVILTNDLLPDMSGLCLLRQLKDDPATRQTPTVLLSGLRHQSADLLPADRVVALPFDIDVLQRAVEALADSTTTSMA
jgi:CheY-like chemotaxis protein